MNIINTTASCLTLATIISCACPAQDEGLALRVLLRTFEGWSAKPYKCPAGHWTIGYGHRCEKGTEEITPTQGELLLDIDIEIARQGAANVIGLDVWGKLTPTARIVATCMAYQMGAAGLGKFKLFRTYLRNGEYTLAAYEMRDSKWAKEQTPSRAHALAQLLVEGK